MKYLSLSNDLRTYVFIFILNSTAVPLSLTVRGDVNPFKVHCTPQNHHGLANCSTLERNHLCVPKSAGHPSERTLAKRIITPFNQRLTTDQFMSRYAALRPPKGPPAIKNIVRSGYGWQSTYISLENSKQPFGIALSGLIGCTAIAVVSNTAVWMAHLWEGIPDITDVFYREFTSFKRELTFDSGMQDPAFTEQQLQVTREYIRRFLQAPMPGFQANLWTKRASFDKPSARVYIMTPMQPFRNLKTEFALKYQRQVEVLQEVIEEATGIGGLSTTVVGYDVWELLTQRNQNTARGRALYLFDPEPPKKQTLWFENVEMVGLPTPL